MYIQDKQHRRIVYQNQHAIVYVEGSVPHEYVFLSKPNKDAVVIVLLDQSKEKVLLVRQYRRPLKKKLIQCVMGAIEKGETPLRAAKRELLEETGIMGDGWMQLGKIHAEPGLSDQCTHIFLAVAKSDKTGIYHEEGVSISGGYYSLPEIESMVLKGVLTCGFTLSALLQFMLYKKEFLDMCCSKARLSIISDPL